jgi:hypothetical protein
MKCLFYFFALLQTFHDFLTDYPYRNFPGRGVYLNAFHFSTFFGFIVTYKVQKVMCLFPDDLDSKSTPQDHNFVQSEVREHLASYFATDSPGLRVGAVWKIRRLQFEG